MDDGDASSVQNGVCALPSSSDRNGVGSGDHCGPRADSGSVVPLPVQSLDLDDDEQAAFSSDGVSKCAASEEPTASGGTDAGVAVDSGRGCGDTATLGDVQDVRGGPGVKDGGVEPRGPRYDLAA